MKKSLLIIAAIGGLMLTACTNEPEWTERYEEATFQVVKFVPEATEYRPNVMLRTDGDGKYYMRRLQDGTCREFFLMHSPYTLVDTVQHWYLVDWKWGIPLTYNHVVLPMRWTDVTRPDEKYVASDFEVAATGIIEKYGYVKRSEIDQYLHLEAAPAAETSGSWGRTSGGISTDHLAPVYLNKYYSTQDIPAIIDKKGDWQYTKQDFLRERLRQDSLQEVYRERLAVLIYAGMSNSVIHVVEK